MRYLVTGSSGVIGSLFSKSRIAAGDEVSLLDDGASARHRYNASAIAGHPMPIQLGDKCPAHQLRATADRILHAAASTGIPYSGQAPLDDWSRNVDGTIEVLEAVRAKPTPTVVLSSVKPYTTANICAVERDDHYMLSGSGVTEREQLIPDEPYAASKAAQSLICQAYARSYDLPIVVFRCSNLCGNAAPHGMRHGFLTNICIRAALGWTVEVQGSGKQTRDILFASDVESAALLAFSALESGDVERGRIFNLGGGPNNTISVLQLVAMLRALGAKFDTRPGQGRDHEDMLFVTDSSAIQRDLGWERKVSVRECVVRIYDWAVANRDALATVYEHEQS